MTEDSGLNKVTDVVSTLIDGVPAPIRRNFLKALGRLSSAVLDIPITWLETKADEIQASSQARIQIIKSQGIKFSNQVEIPQAYIDKASEKYASKIIREQINLDVISQKAAEVLSHEDFTNTHNSDKEISEDWLNEFETSARQMSSDEMRLLFSKILANEAKSPGNFSVRTMRLISQLDNQVAKLFQKLCSCAIAMQMGNHVRDARVVSLEGRAASNSLAKYGLSFDNLNVLQEYGLIISDYHAYMNYRICVVNEQNSAVLPFKLADSHFEFLPLDRDKYEENLNLHGVVFSKSGRELYNIIPKDVNARYKADFEIFLEKRHLKMISVKTG